MNYLYDDQSNSLTITFAEGRTYRDSEEIHDGVILHYDVDGRPYAIEFLQAKAFVDTDGLISGRAVDIAERSKARLT